MRKYKKKPAAQGIPIKEVNKMLKIACDIISRELMPGITPELIKTRCQKRWLSSARYMIAFILMEKYPAANQKLIAKRVNISRCQVPNIRNKIHPKKLYSKDYAEVFKELDFRSGKFRRSDPMVYDSDKKDKELIANLCFGSTKKEDEVIEAIKEPRKRPTLEGILSSDKCDYEKALDIIHLSLENDQPIKSLDLPLDVFLQVMNFKNNKKFYIDFGEKSFRVLEPEAEEI